MRLIPTVPSGHLTSASFTPGTVLPTSTHLSGRITVVWTKLTSETISVPRIAFRLECEMIIDSMTVNDYARSAPNGSKAVFLVHFALRPRGLQEGTSGTAAARLISQMESDQKILMDLQKTGRLLNISCDGLRVVRVERLEKSTGVHLEGSGERTITSKSKGITTILSGGSRAMITLPVTSC